MFVEKYEYVAYSKTAVVIGVAYKQNCVKELSYVCYLYNVFRHFLRGTRDLIINRCIYTIALYIKIKF